MSFDVTPKKLFIKKSKPEQRSHVIKEFKIREGTGRDAGKIYLEFPLEGEFDRRGNQMYGWVEVEKVSWSKTQIWFKISIYYGVTMPVSLRLTPNLSMIQKLQW